MSGEIRPTIYNFIKSLKADESIARAKILSCEAGRDPPKRHKKEVVRSRAIKKSLLEYVKVSFNLSCND